MGQGEGESKQESLAGWLVGQVAEERGRYLKNEGSLPSKQKGKDGEKQGGGHERR